MSLATTSNLTATAIDMQQFEHARTKCDWALSHQEMLVDWFDSWLNEHEHAAPRKAAQYHRWRKLRRHPPRPVR